MRKGLVALAVYLKGRRDAKKKRPAPVLDAVEGTKGHINMIILLTAVCGVLVMSKITGSRSRVEVRPRRPSGGAPCPRPEMTKKLDGLARPR